MQLHIYKILLLTPALAGVNNKFINATIKLKKQASLKRRHANSPRLNHLTP